LPVASCVSRDYTLTVRSLRVTAGRRAALCEERRRIEAGKKILKVRMPPFCNLLLFCHYSNVMFKPVFSADTYPDPDPGL
jgi:hypothetical protein